MVERGTPAALVVDAAGAMQGDCTKYDRARRVVHEFRDWLRCNSWVADKLRSWAKERAESGRRVSSKYVLELLRAADMTDAHGNRATLSNTAAPLLARWLVSEVPEVAEKIVMRRSVFDDVIEAEGWSL